MSTTYLEQPINKVRVRPILTNTSSQSLDSLNMVERTLEDMKGSNNQAVITTDNYQNTLHKEQNFTSNKKVNLQLQRRPHPRISKFREAARKIVPLAVGAIALEAVILFSFSSIEGLFLIISTLAVGTSVYVSDGIKR